MSTINYTYNVIVDRFRQFAAGHFQLRRFTHGEISQADLEKEAEWPWLHVKPRAINYSPGTRSFQFEIFISDLPRDKEDKTGYQAESITDCSLIFQDLINEIYLGNMFGTDVVLTRPVNSEPFVEQYTHTLTGVTGTIELQLDYDWSACSIPASWNYNTPTDSGSDGWGALQFIESLDQNGAFVSLLNDEEAPGNSYYYGTNSSGVKGWYAIVDNVGLTCETLPNCATIISIVDDIAALQTDKVDKIPGKGLSTEDYTTAEKSKLAGIQAGAEVNVNADWNATSGDAQILNKPTIPSIAGLVPDTRTITINGTTQDLSANRTFTIATGLTVGTTPITSGTVGRVLFEGTGNVLQESANFFWDNTNGYLGIKRTPGVEIDVTGSIRASSTIFTDTARLNFIQTNGQNLTVKGASAVSYITMFQSTGNLLLQNGGTFTDAGYRLDVNGTARVQGALTVGSGSLSNSSLLISRGITGSTNVSSVLNTSVIQGDVTFAGGGFTSQIGTQNTTFTLTLLRHFAALQGTIGAGSIVSNQYGFHASSGLVSAQNNFGFRGEIPAGATNWNLYMSGTANNYLAGNLLIGTTTDVASSILTLASTTKGFLPPRMTTTQKNAIASPATGLMVYDTTLNLISVYNGTIWISL
jgi:hypothetical protein